jgi:hypothetical protein
LEKKVIELTGWMQQATIPAKIKPGTEFSIQWQWLNDGVAPLYEPCEVAIAVLDQ